MVRDPDQTFDPTVSDGTVAIPVTIPAGTSFQRYALFDSDVSTDADLDLFVYQGSTLVGYSAAGGSTEIVDFDLGGPVGIDIDLSVYVHGWGIPGGTSPFVLYDWSVPATDAGNMTVSAPSSAVQSETGTIGLSFTGLDTATRYLGSVVYGGPASATAPTIVEVTTP